VTGALYSVLAFTQGDNRCPSKHSSRTVLSWA
jgi:hypothetical protein